MNNKLIIIAGLALAFLDGWLINGWRISAGIEKEKSQAMQEAGEMYRKKAEAINRQAKAYSENAEKLNNQIASLKKELAHAKKPPLPLDCRPDAGRLRILRDAVTAANAATGQ